GQNGSGPNGAGGSEQSVSILGISQHNQCGATDASLLYVTSKASPTCSDEPAAGPESEQNVSVLGMSQHNACGATDSSLLFVKSKAYAHCDGGAGENAKGTAGESSQTVTPITAEQTNPCATTEATLLSVRSKPHSCSPDEARAVPSQQTVTPLWIVQ